MPDTSWSRVHEQGAGQVTVNKIGGGWATDRATDAADPVLHHKLGDEAPGVLAPAAAQPVPTPATERELRAKLAQAIEARRLAHDAEAVAQATALRAADHHGTCRTTLEAFAGLDDEVTAETIAGLRAGGRVELPADLRERLSARDDAANALAAAERAAEVLAAELITARERAAATWRACLVAADAVLGIKASRMAERHDELLAEADQIVESLAAFDITATSTSAGLPRNVGSILLANQGRLARAGTDTSAWISAREELLSDADAVVAITLPELARIDTTPPPVSTVTIATPLRED